MKRENLFLYILRICVTLLLITGVVAAALAGVNAITKDKIAAIQQQKTLDAIVQVLPGVENAEEVAVTGDPAMVKTVYASGNNYAVVVTPTGFSGQITMMVGVMDGKVSGIALISHGETPSLGAEAAADSNKGKSFRDQFVGAAGVLTVGEQIDAISGATITSKAVTEGVNAALAYVESLG